MESITEAVRPMRNVLQVIDHMPVANVQELAGIVGYTHYACWVITDTLRRYGLLEQSLPFKLTDKGNNILQELKD